MKEKDLYVDFKPQQAVYYVEKDDGSFGLVISGSQLSHDYLDDFFQKKAKLEEQLRDKLVNRTISPIYYYMILQELGEGDLASRVGISKRALRRHCQPKHFEKISLNLLKKYATVFDVPLVSLLQLIVVKQEDKNSISIEYQETKNDSFVILRISKKQHGKDN